MCGVVQANNCYWMNFGLNGNENNWSGRWADWFEWNFKVVMLAQHTSAVWFRIIIGKSETWEFEWYGTKMSKPKLAILTNTKWPDIVRQESRISDAAVLGLNPQIMICFVRPIISWKYVLHGSWSWYEQYKISNSIHKNKKQYHSNKTSNCWSITKPHFYIAKSSNYSKLKNK